MMTQIPSLAMVDFHGIMIESVDIENFLKQHFQLKEICQKILYQRIIKKLAQEYKISVTAEEIQVIADRQRREKRLEKATDTLAWLADQMIAPEDWEMGIQEDLLAQKLSNTLFSQEVERYFAQNRLNFESAILYQMVIPYEKLAWEIFYQIEEEEISFYQAAHLYDIDEKRRLNCGYEGKVYRGQLPPNISSIVFQARPKEILQPLKIEEEYHLFMMEEFLQAELTEEVHQEILQKLFSEWLTNELNYLLYQSG
jgi:parvulin-like peptidyl-prolyl isomerase